MSPRKNEEKIMRNAKNEDNSKLSVLAVGTMGLAGAALLGIITAGSVHRSAEALPAYSEQTKLPCGQCHTNPAGGKDLTDFGKKFQANGHKLPNQ
jgi:hypothetical protein